MTSLKENLSTKTEVEKPLFLYHASSNRGLKQIEPSRIRHRDKSEGPLVFASTDKKLLSCFLTRTDGSWAQISTYTFGNHKIYTHCIADKERFMKLDKGGVIYKVSSDDFNLNITQKFEEWTTKKSVEVLDKKIYDSSLEAMMENDVRVYFCTKEQLEEIRNSVNDLEKSFQILDSIGSENEVRGLTTSISEITAGNQTP
jgi:hypothetical protein